jgi:hypothetical protein
MAQRRRLIGRCLAALAWAVVLFAVGQVALRVWLSRCHPELCDPDHNARLALLKARVAEAPGRPLVVVLGSSRAANGVSPADMGACGPPDGPEPVVFNFATLGAGPVRQWLTLRRLLAEGCRPDWVLIEVCPLFWPQVGMFNEETGVLLTDVYWSDLPAIASVYPGKRWETFAKLCTETAAPGFHFRSHVLNYCAPFLLQRVRLGELVWGHAGWQGLDEHGWLPGPPRPPDAEFAAAVVRQRQLAKPIFDGFCVHPASDQSLRRLLQECRAHGLPAALYFMPEHSVLRGWYSPSVSRQVGEYLARLRQEYGVVLFDARAWMADDAFVDFCHMHPGGARAFSVRFGREVVQPLLRGQVPAPHGPSPEVPGASRPNPL